MKRENWQALACTISKLILTTMTTTRMISRVMRKKIRAPRQWQPAAQEPPLIIKLNSSSRWQAKQIRQRSSRNVLRPIIWFLETLLIVHLTSPNIGLSALYLEMLQRSRFQTLKKGHCLTASRVLWISNRWVNASKTKRESLPARWAKKSSTKSTVS